MDAEIAGLLGSLIGAFTGIVTAYIVIRSQQRLESMKSAKERRFDLLISAITSQSICRHSYMRIVNKRVSTEDDAFDDFFNELRQQELRAHIDLLLVLSSCSGGEMGLFSRLTEKILNKPPYDTSSVEAAMESYKTDLKDAEEMLQFLVLFINKEFGIDKNAPTVENIHDWISTLEQ